MKKLLANYFVILDENADNTEVDLRFLDKGYIFDKKLSFIPELNSITEINALCSEDDTALDKIYKIAKEYITYFLEHVIFDDINFTYDREIIPVLNKIKTIKVLNLQEFQEFCNNLARVNKAYDSDMLQYISKYLTLKPEEIKVKELKVFYTEKLIEEKKYIGGKDLIRYIEYLLTGATVFYNYKRNHYEMENRKDIYSLSVDKHIEELIDIFTYYNSTLAAYYNNCRDFFMAIKVSTKSKELRKQINNLYRKAHKNNLVKQKSSAVDYNIHKIYTNYEYISVAMDNIRELVDSLSLKELCKIYDIISKHKTFKELGHKYYVIRNGKTFLKEYLPNEDYVINESIFNNFFRTILKNKFKDTEIILPKEYKSPLICSDKKRVGGIYFGSAISLKDGDSIGVDWKMDVDIDLSLYHVNENKVYSWDSRDSLNKTRVFFSEDCRRAGSEYMKFHKIEEDDLFDMNVALYSCSYAALYGCSSENNEFSIFIKDKDNNIKWQSENISFDKSYGFTANSLTVGVIKNKQFLLDVTEGKNVRVMEYNRDELNYQSIKLKLNTIFLEDIFDEIGIKYEKISMYELPEDKELFDINKY